MRILLSEDDPSIQAIAKMALQKVGNHEVISAKDGEETLEILKSTEVDLLLLDIMMPKLTGFEVCKAMQTNNTHKNTPVIFLTAKAQVQDIQQGMSMGAIGYILKPFDPMKLNEQIMEILNTHAAA